MRGQKAGLTSESTGKTDLWCEMCETKCDSRFALRVPLKDIRRRSNGAVACDKMKLLASNTR
jgi:hypothetical protein